MKARLLLPAIAVVAVILGSAPASAANVPAKRWAKSVCNAVTDWSDDVDDVFTGADAPPVDAAAARTSILRLLKRVRSETRTLLGDLEDAGTPNITGGKDAATALRDGYEEVLAAVTAARKGVKAAATTDAAAFALVADGALATATTALTAVADAFETEPALNTTALLKAFRAQPACRDVAGRG